MSGAADPADDRVGPLRAWAADRLAADPDGSARLDAELLLAHVLRVGRTTVLAHPEAPVGTGPAATFRALVARRAAGEPVAYLRGLREFHGLALACDARALIPRPETELLVEHALAAIRARLAAAPRTAGTRPVRAWDIGTGTGAIAIALAAALRKRGALADVALRMSDLSADALALARENVVAHGLADAITPAEGDLLATDPPPDLPVDVICANLPYVATAEIAPRPDPTAYEPRTALDGGPDGLDLVRRLLAGLGAVLAPVGVAFLEIGADQGPAALAAAGAALPGRPAVVHADLAGRPRLLEVGPAA
ncbi:MAG: peptide chain release factor N(5)-glutamine methyltransferase [Chloroflexota bacterium]